LRVDKAAKEINQ